MIAHFDSWDERFKKPFGAVEVSTRVFLFIQTEGVEFASVRIWDDEKGEVIVPMKKGSDGFYADFTSPDSGRLLWYHFILRDECGSTCYYGNGSSRCGGSGCLSDGQCNDYQLTVFKRQDIPEWFRCGITYQIFPDRFAKDEKSKDRADAGGMKLLEWGTPPRYKRNAAGDVTEWDFYGGSLEGITGKLLYLKSLGVSAIYLNPIFKAKSNHRYDTQDFFRIDPLLGTEEDFIRLCKSARESGIRIILDGVFSHVGSESVYFKEGSEFRKWFKFDDSEIGYKAWWGVKDLPEINELEPSYIDFICGEGGVIEHWLKAGASGFRLDVADELPDEFIRHVRTAVKACGKDNVLIGEVWEDASSKVSYGEKRRYLMGDELDSVMNYPLRAMALDFANGRTDGQEFQHRFMSLYENYPKNVFFSLLNILGSHDTRRLISEVGGSREKVKMLFALVFALPGVPSIYYGDELTMAGGADPENRACMNWREDADWDMHYSLRMLKVIYSEHRSLKDGEYRPLFPPDADLFAFERLDGDERILAIANRNASESKAYRVETEFKYALDLISSKRFEAAEQGLTVTVPPLSSMILLLKDSPPKTLLRVKSSSNPGRVGVIAPVFSIPGGKLGKSSKAFIDWLSECGMTLWQVLPMHPTGMGGSPYLSPDLFKLNSDFISRDEVSLWRTYSASDDDIFLHQWHEVREYAHRKGISIIGDMPIYADPQGCDIKRNPECFLLDGEGRLSLHGGVPGDYFQPEGQDWGSPLYDWERMADDGYDWWMRRIGLCCDLFDYIRLDHFRGFSEFFAIPQGGKPKDGAWLTGPGMRFFKAVRQRFPQARFIAEDLGSLDNAVFNLLELTGIPGMNVWQFSSGEMERMRGEACANRIFYSGTHDNSTLLSWCKGDRIEAESIITALCKSDAPWVIFQLQDLLFLDDKARMNIPGTVGGNWSWRCPAGLLDKDRAKWIRSLLERTGRLGAES